MNKPLFLFVGKSASGKTTVANILEKQYGYVQVQSYTTRKPRFEGETGHIFVNEDDVKNMDEFAAYTYYNKNHYWTTFKQLEESDIYVVDVPGVKLLLQKFKKDKRPIVIFYFDASVHCRILRMKSRGDNNDTIIERLLQDEKDEWLKQINQLVNTYSAIHNKYVELHQINASSGLSNVVDLVLYYMNKYKED